MIPSIQDRSIRKRKTNRQINLPTLKTFNTRRLAFKDRFQKSTGTPKAGGGMWKFNGALWAADSVRVAEFISHEVCNTFLPVSGGPKPSIPLSALPDVSHLMDKHRVQHSPGLPLR